MDNNGYDSKNLEKDNLTKDWTEPNGVFILHIPMDWQYRNPVIKNLDPKHKNIYSFESYKDSKGCFQLSCYPLSEQKININFPIQSANSKISWLPKRMDDSEFYIYLWYAQVDDHFLMAKYISSKAEKESEFIISGDLVKVESALKSLRVIPVGDRNWATNLDKHDSFIASLFASYNLLELASESGSFIEGVILASNQIDAFLRLSIILHTQNVSKTNDIEVKYLYQNDDESGILERVVYKKALDLNIISQNLYDRLESLYKNRNKVVHRYIISKIKTRDIADIFMDYLEILEEVRKILALYEETQIGQGFGLYGKGYSKLQGFDLEKRMKLNSMLNDKHLIKKLYRDL